MGIIANLQDGNLWEPAWNDSFAVTPVPGTSNVYPIGTIAIPVLTSNQVIGLYIGSNDSPPNWKYAGMLRQVVSTGLVVGGLANAQFSQHKVYLNRINIIDLPKATTDSALYLDVPYWIPDISLNLFEFTGSVVNRENSNVKVVNVITGTIAPRTEMLNVNSSRLNNYIVSITKGGVLFLTFGDDVPNISDWSTRLSGTQSYSSTPFTLGKLNLFNSSATANTSFRVVEFG